MKSAKFFQAEKEQDASNLSTGLTMDYDHVIFSLMGPKEIVRKSAREILCGDLFESGFQYKHIDNMTNQNHTQYDFYVRHGHLKRLRDMFWYFGKITNNFPDGDQLLRDYSRKIFVTPIFDFDNKCNQNKGLTAAECLKIAANAAKAKRNEVLAIKERYQPEDRALWTKEEIQLNRTMKCS